MSKGIIIAGTSAEVGKTYIASLIVTAMNNYGLNTGYYKVSTCGGSQAELSMFASGVAFASYLYQTQAAPHIAAMIENRPIEKEQIQIDFFNLQQRYEYLCVESNGGMMCPLRIDGSTTLMMSDILQEMYLPVVLVSSLVSDKVNHLLLSIQYARSKHLPLKGVILNRYNPQSAFCKDKLKELESVLDIPIICVIEENADILPLSKSDLIYLFE